MVCLSGVAMLEYAVAHDLIATTHCLSGVATLPLCIVLCRDPIQLTGEERVWCQKPGFAGSMEAL